MGGSCVAVVLAGGSGARFGAPVSKVYVDLAGRPLLSHSLARLSGHPAVDAVVAVIRPQDRSAFDAAVLAAGAPDVLAVVSGGATRQASEWAGITAVREHAPDTEMVLLHDGARPLLTDELVSELLDAAVDGAAAIPGVSPRRMLITVDGRPVRVEDLVGVQTPQAFPLQLLLDTYPRAMADGFDGVDTSETVTAYADVPVHVVRSSRDNLKVTYPADLDRAVALLGACHPV